MRIEYEFHGERLAFTGEELRLGDPEDPSAMLERMERLPSTLGYYLNVLREAKQEVACAKESEEAAKAVVAHEIANRGLSETKAGEFKRPPAAEVERALVRETDGLLRALETGVVVEKDERWRRYGETIRERREWADLAGKMEVVVETVRMRCSMIRSQSELLTSMLQQNIIRPPRETPTIMGSAQDDGNL